MIAACVEVSSKELAQCEVDTIVQKKLIRVESKGTSGLLKNMNIDYIENKYVVLYANVFVQKYFILGMGCLLVGSLCLFSFFKTAIVVGILFLALSYLLTDNFMSHMLRVALNKEDKRLIVKVIPFRTMYERTKLGWG
jgi:hypothetical protein